MTVRIVFLSIFFIVSCSFSGEQKAEAHKETKDKAECPEGHTDDVIPIIYGFPTKEAFQKADSGLLVLAGCILPENPKFYFCKKHKIEF